MEMIDYNKNAMRDQNPVDWDDPELQKLLGKTAGWGLDNREIHPRQPVQIQVGWKAASGNPATLVWTKDQVMVLEVDFEIPSGEFVRIDEHYGAGVRSVWGVVVEGRPGKRDDDRRNGVNIYWLHKC